LATWAAAVTTILHKIVTESPSLAESTRGKYLRDLDTWIAFAGSDSRGWTRYRAQEFYRQLIGKMKPQTANRVLASLRYASSWWAKKESNPALDFAVVEKAGASHRAQRRALAPEDAVTLLSTCKRAQPIDLRDSAMLVVGLETGMRLMSLRAMSWETLRTSREGYPVAFVPLKGSNGELYPVPISDTALAALEPWRTWCKSQKVTKGPIFRGLYRRLARSAKVQYQLGDDALSKPAIYKIVSRRATGCGLAGIHPHILRHTFITWRMQQGLMPYQIAAITGHKIAGLAGMGALGGYVDAARVGAEVRNSTPEWLKKLVGK
jgi:integrase